MVVLYHISPTEFSISFKISLSKSKSPKFTGFWDGISDGNWASAVFEVSSWPFFLGFGPPFVRWILFESICPSEFTGFWADHFGGLFSVGGDTIWP